MYIRISSLGLLLAFVLSAAGLMPQNAPPPEEFNLENYEFVPDQLLVQFKPTVRNERADQVLAEHSIERLHKIKQIGVDVLQLPKGLTVEKALEIFSRRAEVAYAEPNYIIELASNIQAEITDQWGLQKIEAQAAWAEFTNPDPALIAVVDTGVDPNNPDLDSNIWTNSLEIAGNGLDDDGNGKIDDTWGWDFVNNDNDPMDDNMHGTAVSSVAAGNQDGQGVAGVCPWCKVMPVKVISAEGSGSLDITASGIIYAADNGAKVINLSLSAPTGMQSLENAINYAWNAGVLVVAAAGNNGSETVVYPAGYQNAMTVASTDSDDHHSCFSNYSDGFVSVAAPGSGIRFAYLPGGTATGDGTSLATPHVVGLAGLLLSQDASRTNQELWNLIEDSSNDLGPVGYDPYFGAGRINAYRAVTGDTASTTPPDEDYVLNEDATAYAHARKLARTHDGVLHMVWYEKEDGSYLVQYASSSDDGATWNTADEPIFSSTEETYHPAITADKNNLYVVFPSLSGATNYQVFFMTKPISGGEWSNPTPILGGGYHAVRPDIYLDPSNNRIHVVASSFDNARYAYYRSSDDGGASWTNVRNVDFVYYTRYASVYAYGDRVYIASRLTDGNWLIPTYYVSMMRSLDGGVTFRDRQLFASHLAFTSGEYGLSLAGFEDTFYILYEHANTIRFGKSNDGVNWEQVNIYTQGGGKWPTMTATPDGQAWLAWLKNYDVMMVRNYLGGPLNQLASYDPPEDLYATKYPNFKMTTSYGRADWVSTDCSGAPFGLSYDYRPTSGNMPPLAFFDASENAQSGAAVQFDAAESYDPDGHALTYSWDFGDGNLGSGITPSHTFDTGGEFTVTLTLSDALGETDTATATISVEQTINQPPTAVVGGPYSSTEDAQVGFDGSGSLDPEGVPLSYDWDFGDGGTATGPTPSHTYLYGGDFTVRLTVSDGTNTDFEETTVSITEVNDQPTAVTNGPYSAEAGQAIVFDASGSSDPDNTDSSTANDQTLTYLWDFGDGNTSTLVAPSHSYAEAGEYTVSLTVDDGSGEVNAADTTFTTAAITAAQPASMHIGDLDGSRITIKNRWVAIVNIFVHDEQEQPVAGAEVTGTWSNGFDGSSACTTDANGWCQVQSAEVLKKTSSVDFSIDAVSHATLAYTADDNHDPETDSDGSMMTVYLEPPAEPTPIPTLPPSGGSLHVGDLEGTGMSVRTKWEAMVTVLVHNQDGSLVVGALVTGGWDAGGEATCVTEADGTCSVTKNNLKTTLAGVNFTVTDITLSGYVYYFSENHDLDGDSNGTKIFVPTPQ